MVAALNLGLLVCAALVALGILTSLLSLRFGAPLLLVFLAVGLAAGEDGIGGIHFDDAGLVFAICSVALAVVLFDSGFETRWHSYRVAAKPALVLATLGVLVTTGLFAAAAHWWMGLPWKHALLLGAMVSSTDAAAVFFLLRVGGAVVRDRVRSTLEIESGTNDPMAIFLTTALLTLITAGDAHGGALALALEFAREMGLGTVLGAGGGWAIAALLRRLPLERGLVPLLALSLALCLFAATNMLGGSGYLAVYAAGIVVGNSGITEGVALRRFQGAFTWLGQIVMFIALGLFATPSEFLPVLGDALLLAAVLMFVARPLAAALTLLPFGFSRDETLLTGWVGLRGAVSLLLAILPLLARVEHARTLFNVTFVIVLVSLLVQGWTLVPVARRLRQVVPARSGPVERSALDMPGLSDHELVCYRIAADSPIAAGATLPRWSRPSLVVRRGESMRIREAGPLQPGDLVYLIVKDERIPLLDRIFAATRRPEKSDREFFGDFALTPDVTLSDIAASYGVAVPLRDAGLTVAEALSREFDAAPTVGDRLRLGAVELIVRDVDVGGRVAEVGLALKP
jgi:potassium/hydrogen antiporter